MAEYIDTIIANLQAAQDEANAANEARYEEAKSIYDTVIAQYEEGGAFDTGVEAQIASASKKSVAQSQSALVSSGLSNTSSKSNLQQKFEKNVGSDMRLKANDSRLDSLAAAQTAKAGLIERVEDEGPDPTLIANLSIDANKGS